MTNSEKFLKENFKKPDHLTCLLRNLYVDQEATVCSKAETYSADKDPNSQDYGLPSGHIQFWELDHKQSRMSKNWCLQNVVLEKTPESHLDSKIKPVNPKGEQPWIFTERTDAEAKAPILWPPDVNSWLIGKDLDAWKDWRQKEKRGTKDEMDRWHYWFNGHELGQTPGDGEGQRSPACCSPWNGEELDKTWHLSNNNWLTRVSDAWNTAYHVVWLLENAMNVNSTQCIDPQTVNSVSMLSEW